MDQHYNIYFDGQVMPDCDASQVRVNLQKLFNADAATLDKLFSGSPQCVKRNCDRDTAVKYKQAMERAGAKALVQKVAVAAPEPEQTAVPAEPKMSMAERIAAMTAAEDAAALAAEQEAMAAQENEKFTLAPVGSDVLEPAERAEIPSLIIDTSHLAMAEVGATLAEGKSEEIVEAPNISALSMAEPGEFIPNLPSDIEPLNPNTDSISLSPQGTDFSDCVASVADAPDLDLSALDLAPTGADVLAPEYRKLEQRTAPDTSHISLEE